MITYRSRKNPLKVKLNLSLFYGFFRMIFDWKTDPSCEYNWRWKTSPPPPLFWVVAELMWDEKVRWNGNTTIFESIDFCLVWGPINKTQWGAIYRRVVATAAYITEIEKKWYTYHHHLWKSFFSEAKVVNFSFWNFVMPPSSVTFLVETFGDAIRVNNSNIFMA